METYHTHDTEVSPHSPKVGVVLSVYNGEETLDRCIDSLLNQTLLKTGSLHIFIVDDGSTDSTPAKIVALEEAHSEFFTVITHNVNSGLAEGRNSGLEAARARCEFVGFVDADDTIHPRMFEDMANCVATENADIAVCDYAGTDAQGEELFVFGSGTVQDFGNSITANPRMLFFLGASVCNKLFRISLFDESPFPSGRYFEDLFVTYGVALRAKKIVKLDSVFYYYRLGNSESIMGTRNRRYFELFDAIESVVSSFKKPDLMDRVDPWLSLVCVQHLLLGRTNDVLLSNAPGLRREFIDRAFSYLDMQFPDWKNDVRNCSEIPTRLRVVSTRKWLLSLYTRLRSVK